MQRFDSGLEGLKAIPVVQPDLIISAFTIGDMDGRTLFHGFVNNHPEYQHIPFVMFSDAKTRAKHARELFDLGLSGWFTKPFGSHELHEVLQNLFMAHEVVQKNRELRQEIKRSEYKYRDLLENANDFIFTLDESGRFIYLNNRFTPLTGWEKGKWVGKEFLELISTEDRDHVHTYYEMAHQGRARLFEAKAVSNTEASPILSFNITPIFEKGRIVGSIGIARDVTEQRKMEEEMLELKNFNESIIQSMEAGLLTTDLYGNLTSLNAGAERILGIEADSVVGKPIESVLKPEEAHFLVSNPPSPKTLPYSRETELTVKSGKKISIGFTATDRIDNNGNKVGTILSFRDISDLKQMQTEVIRMDRLASLGVLASGIAHEIKNPLAGIKTMAQACEEEFEEGDPRSEYLVRIVRQVNRLDDLLKTFFAYARPRPPDKKPHDIRDILREVINLVGKKLSICGITYMEKFDEHLSKVHVDSQQIQQVFLNLILNAIEAMTEGGHLRISALNVSAASNNSRFALVRRNNGTFVEVEVRDSGHGIEPEKLQTIFDPFFTTKPSGLGLGLSIVYRIIEEHRGDIRVESQPGEGTTFTMILPTGES